MPNSISLALPVPNYWAKLRREYFPFPDFWSITYKKNCHNSRTSYDIDIKLGPVNKLNKINISTPTNFEDDVMSTKCDVIVFFPIYGQFAAIR